MTLVCLPDINVLLALAWSNHSHHDAAHDWFSREAGGGWATCLATQTGFLRLSLNPQVVGVSINCAAGMSLLEGLVSHAAHQFVEIAPEMTRPPFDELRPKITGYRQVPDATLLHVARSQSLKLVTFDTGMTRMSPWAENVELLTR